MTERRAAIAATRGRLEARIDELAQHVPDRDELRASAVRFGAAAVTVVIGVGLVVLVTRSRIRDRQARREGRAYADALVKAWPDVAKALRRAEHDGRGA